MKSVNSLLLLSLLLSPSATADEQEFRAFFDEWVSLAHTFDSAMVDRYADDAEISYLQRGEDGSIEVTSADCEQYASDAGDRQTGVRVRQLQSERPVRCLTHQ